MKLSIETNGHAYLVVSSGGNEVRRIDIKQALDGMSTAVLQDDLLGEILIEEGSPNDVKVKGYMSVPVTALFVVPVGIEMFIEAQGQSRRITGGQVGFTHVKHDRAHHEKRTADSWTLTSATFDFVKEEVAAEALVA